MTKKYWLMKSEPTTFGIHDLAQRPKQTEPWEGVRNYQARNFMRDDMQVGDEAFFYHSNCKLPGIVGTVKIVKAAYPDHFALDKSSAYFDPKSTKDDPRWFMVDVQLQQIFDEVIPLTDLKNIAALQDFALVKKGNRLSIMPVSAPQWRAILKIHEASRKKNATR